MGSLCQNWDPGAQFRPCYRLFLTNVPIPGGCMGDGLGDGPPTTASNGLG